METIQIQNSFVISNQIEMINEFSINNKNKCCLINRWVGIVTKKTGFKFNSLVYVHSEIGYQQFIRSTYFDLAQFYKIYSNCLENINGKSAKEFVNERYFKQENILFDNSRDYSEMVDLILINKIDVIIISTSQSEDVCKRIFKRFPDKKFIIIHDSRKPVKLNRSIRLVANVIININYRTILTYKLKMPVK